MSIKKETIKTSWDFMDACLFASWRYFIGRSSIHAYAHAGDIADFLRVNPDLFPKNRLDFMGQDITRCINDVINWTKGVTIDHSHITRPQNTLIILTKAIRDLFHELDVPFNEETLKDYEFELDCLTGKYKYRFSQGSSNIDFSNLVSNLSTWSKLAGYLTKPLLITYKDTNGEEHTEPGFEFPGQMIKYVGEDDFRIETHYNICSEYSKYPHKDSYINPKYIISVNRNQDVR